MDAQNSASFHQKFYPRTKESVDWSSDMIPIKTKNYAEQFRSKSFWGSFRTSESEGTSVEDLYTKVLYTKRFTSIVLFELPMTSKELVAGRALLARCSAKRSIRKEAK